jgi:hypothetical protein
LIFAVLIALGGYYLLNNNKLNKIIISLGVLIIPFLYSTSKYMVIKMQKGREFNEIKAYKGGLDYYMTPWMNNNVGIVEFTLEGKKSPDPMHWMTDAAKKFIELRKKKNPNENVKDL